MGSTAFLWRRKRHAVGVESSVSALKEPGVQLRLRAVAGWMELGLPEEGLGELADLPPEVLEHPEMLKVRFSILRPLRRFADAFQTAEQITNRAPGDKWGWLYRSHALHWMGRSGEAYSQLEPLREKFPQAFELPYDLACYCAQTGRLDEARQLLEECFKLSGAKCDDVRGMARKDPDLEPLWDEIARDS